jgi:predicted nucleic acid-binding protein
VEFVELPNATVASDAEVLSLIELNKLHGTGVGYVDCHILASALLSGGELWSRNKRMSRIASFLHIEGESG